MGAGTVLDLWPTVILTRQVADAAGINADLQRDILAREAGDRSRSLGVVGGRKSGPDLLRWGTQATNRISALVGEVVEEVTAATAGHSSALGDPVPTPESFTAHAWAVVYRQGGYHTLHAHHDSAWSGVYYVAADPSPAGGGAIHLYDPRSALLARQGDLPNTAIARIQPEPGTLLAFPSWLLHSVTPVARPDLRISVAFNISFP
ncbi:TIGR02466 family protein [Micromonospora chokoriensis]